MTGFMHEKALSRKTFLKGGGALIVSFSALGAAGTAQAASGNTPFGQRTPNDFLPNLQAIDSWLAITPDNKVIVTHGETEFAGTPTGILMLVAEELNITDMSMMVYAHPETWLNATGGGGGSGGISSRSTQTRAAAAYAMQILNTMASQQLGVPVSQLSASNGVISGGGKSVKYSDLIGGKMFNYVMPLDPTNSTSPTATQYIPGAGISKPVAKYQLVGKAVHRIDIPAKVMGTYTYIHNVRVPGMLHARSVRPRGAGADGSQNHFPLSVDPSSIKDIPGAQVVQINNFLAVVAPKEYDAIQAAAQLKVVWKSDPKFGDGGSGNYWSWLRKAGDTNTQNPPRYTADTGGVDAEGRVRHLQVPLQQLRADRPALRGRRRRHEERQRDHLRPGPVDQRHPAVDHERARRAADAGERPAAERAGDLVRDVRLLRRRPAGRGGRGGRGALGHGRQARAHAVDALGPARLG